jgi:hypothetical protein
MYRTLHTALVTALTAAALTACAATITPVGAPPPPGPGPRHEARIIEGTVFEAGSHQPLDRAAVDITSPSMQGITVNTGPDGHFRTPELPRGEVAIRCHREGYLVEERRAVVDGVTRMDFGLRRR